MHVRSALAAALLCAGAWLVDVSSPSSPKLLSHYDIGLKDRFDELFGMTDIGRNPTPLRNSFLVLTFDFSTVQVGTLAEIERNFVEHVRGRIGRFAAQ